ncbi:hypothetical protein QQF64_034334, partial [Cirrhinus molitorella]
IPISSLWIQTQCIIASV